MSYMEFLWEVLAAIRVISDHIQPHYTTSLEKPLRYDNSTDYNGSLSKDYFYTNFYLLLRMLLIESWPAAVAENI